MQSGGSPHFWKHQDWCGGCSSNHRFCECVYNVDRRTRDYFSAPCCGRPVRFLVRRFQCKKCAKIPVRVNKRVYELNSSDFEPQGLLDLSITHKLDPTQVQSICEATENATITHKVDSSQLDAILSGLETTCGTLNQVQTAVVDQMMSLLGPKGDSVAAFIAKAALCLAAVWRAREDATLVIICIAQFLASLDITFAVVSAFQEYVTKKIFGVVPQSPNVEDIFCVVAYFLNVVTFGQAPSAVKLTNFFRNVSSLRSFKDITCDVFGTIKDLVLSALDFVTENFLGYSTKWSKSTSYDLVCDWCDQVDALFVKSNAEEWTLDMLDTLDNLVDTHKAIQDMWRSSKPPVKVVSIFQSHVNVMRKMLEEVAIRGIRQIPRAEPTFVMLQGPSAFGKSLITPVFATDLLHGCVKIEKKAAWSSYVYNRNAETNFWDGYTGQKIIIYDDFGQLFDSHASPNPELMEIIRLGNSAPFFPNMARLEAKGRTRINCDFVILTCNQTPTLEGIGSMKQPDAVLRRIDFLVEVGMKPEFMVPTVAGAPPVVNFARILQEHAQGKCGCDVDATVDMCLGCYQFTVKKWFSDSFVIHRVGLSYSQLVELVSGEHKVKHTKSQKRVDYINSRLGEREVFHDAKATTSQNVSAQSGLDPQRSVLASFHDFLYAYSKATNYYERVDLVYTNKYVVWLHLKILNNMHPEVLLFIRSLGIWSDFDIDLELYGHDDGIYVPQGGVIGDGSFAAYMSDCLEHVGCKSTTIWTSEHTRRLENWFAGQDLTYAQLLALKVLSPTPTDPTHVYLFGHLTDLDLAKQRERISDREGDARLVSLRHLVNDVRANVPQAIKHVEEWLSDPAYAGVVEAIQSCGLGADYLLDIVEQEETPYIEYVRVSKMRQSFESVRQGVLEKMKKYATNPVFYLVGALGAAALATFFAKFLYPLFKPSEPLGHAIDLVNIRKVGDKIKRDVVKHDAIRVDDTNDCLYIRLDKGKFTCETSSWSNSEPGEKRGAKNWRQNAKQYSHKQHYTTQQVVPNTFADPGITDMEKMMCKSMVALYRENGDVRTFAGHGLLVKGRIMLTFNHLFSTEFKSLVVKRILSKQEFVFPNHSLKKASLCVNGQVVDAVLVELPRQFPSARDITAHFCPAEGVTDTWIHARMISVRGLADSGAIRMSSGNAVASDEPISYELNANGKKNIHYVRRSYHHWMDTASGDCGAVVMQVGTHLPNKIIGIHVAGANKDPNGPNIACAVTREQVEDALTAFNDEAKLSPTLDGLPVQYDVTAQCNNLPDFSIFAKVESGAQDATRSLLLKSPMYEWYGDAVTKPAVLYATVDGKDLKTSMVIDKNSQRPMISFDTDFLVNATEEGKRRMNSFALCGQDINTRPLSIEEVVFGIEGDSYINSMSVDSSAGYPWVLKTHRKGKRDFIDLDKKTMSTVVRDAVLERVKRAKQWLRTPAIFTDHLKDERRPIEKNKFMKPRIFSAGPIDYTIAFKQYFGAYIAYCMRHRIENTIAVGINVHGVEWTYLAEKLLTRGNNILAGDFSKYDSSLNGEMLWRVLDVVNDWYNDGEDQVRTVLWAELVDALHLFRNTIYQVGQGNPSGNPMTTILNSIYQYIAWVYVVQKCGMEVAEFVERCVLVTYGDDNVMSVFDKCLDPQDIVEGFRSIGMELTSETKDSEFGYRDIGEVRFLKRLFRYDEEVCRYLAPMPLELVVESTYWYHKGHHWNEIAPMSCDGFAREMAHFPSSTFHQLLRAFREALKRRGLSVPAFNTIGSYRMKMLAEEDYIGVGLFQD